MFSAINVSSDKKKACFKIKKVDLSIVNSLRRIILSDLLHVAIHFDSCHPEDNDINIITNTSSFHNEFLGHRISLLPIHLPPSMTPFSKDEPIKLKFKLEAENKGTSVVIVTTKDIKIFDDNGLLFDENLHNFVFPPFSPEPGKNFYPAIVRLKPSLDGQGINIEFRARMDTAKTHARWCPVSLCTFENLVDDKLADEARSQIPSDDYYALNKFDTLARQRYFVTNKFGDPSAFVFKLESESSLTAGDIFAKGLDVLDSKLTHVAGSLESRTVKTEALENGISIFTFENEDHTFGNLLQCMVYNAHSKIRGDGKVEYVGYYVPHPLKSDMILKIKPADGRKTADMTMVLLNVIKATIKHIKNVKRSFMEFSQSNMLLSPGNDLEIYGKDDNVAKKDIVPEEEPDKNEMPKKPTKKKEAAIEVPAKPKRTTKKKVDLI